MATTTGPKTFGRMFGRNNDESESNEDVGDEKTDEPVLPGELLPTKDVEKAPGDDTDYTGYFTLSVYFSMLTQAIYALILFVYVIMQLNTLGAFYIAATYTSFMGVLLFGAVTLSAVFPSTIRHRQENALSFLVFFVIMYVITVAWMWTFFVRNPTFSFHHDKSHSPLPLTVAFLPYVGLSIWVIFSTLFFLMFAFAVLNQRSSTAISIKLEWVGMSRDRFGVSNMLVQAFGFFALLSGVIYGFMQFFWVLGFDTGSLWGPQILFILYSIFFFIQGVFYFVIAWYRQSVNAASVGDATGLVRGANRLLSNAFLGHWEEIDHVEFFMALFWAINFGFWVRIWTLDHVEYTARLKFDGPPTTVFFSLVANAIISTVCVPLFGYYMVTFMCYTQYVIGTDKSLSMYQIGYRSILSIVGNDGLAVVKEQADLTSDIEEYRLGSKSSWNRALVAFFFSGVLFTIAVTVIILIDLVNGGNNPNKGHYLNSRFRTWEWVIFFVTGAYWVVYFVYALISAWRVYVREGGGFRNAMALCVFGRPLVTYALAIFIVDFGYGWVYDKHNIGGKIPHVLTNDPTNPLSVIYWAILMISFSMFVPQIMAFKDMLSGLLGLMFVMEETDKVTMRGLFNDSKNK